jgi:hypothetical protein
MKTTDQFVAGDTFPTTGTEQERKRLTQELRKRGLAPTLLGESLVVLPDDEHVRSICAAANAGDVVAAVVLRDFLSDRDIPFPAALAALCAKQTRALEGETHQVHLGFIRADRDVQARAALSEEAVEEYADVLRAGDKLPPVILFDDPTFADTAHPHGGYAGKARHHLEQSEGTPAGIPERHAHRYWLADGFHRVEAHRRAGKAVVNAIVKVGTKRDAQLYAAGANGKHGVHRSNADKRRAVFTLLNDPEWQQWSSKRIAKHCCVSGTFVDNLRRELSDNVVGCDEVVPPRPRTRLVERNGTAYEMELPTRTTVSDDQQELPSEDDGTMSQADTDDRFNSYTHATYQAGTLYRARRLCEHLPVQDLRDLHAWIGQRIAEKSSEARSSQAE